MKRLVLALALVFIQVPVLWADVQVYDSIAVPGTPVMLKARTGGRFLAEGGQLVDFSVEGSALGRRLSGGDGVAYMEYTPRKPGLFEIKAAWGDDVAVGSLLVIGKKDRVVVVEIAGALSTGEFLPVARPGAAGAVKKLLERYRVIYMSSGILGATGYRAWLREQGFPSSIVLAWKGEHTMKHLLDIGVHVTAAVGGAGFIHTVDRSEDIKLFSFDPDSEGTRVRSWDDVLKELLP